MIESGPKFHLSMGVVCSGALLACAQVILIRKALALAGGDEVVFALTLAIWLLAVAVGSALGSWLLKFRWGRSEARLAPAFAAGLLLLSISTFTAPLMLASVAARSGWISGTVPGGGGLAFPLIVALLPLGLCGGALFPLSCAVQTSFSRNPVSRAYLLEAVGSFLAGSASALIFAPHLPSLALPAFCSALGIGLSLLMLLPRVAGWTLAGLILASSLALWPQMRRLDFSLTAMLRPGQKILDVLQTPYGLIEICERQGQISIYENGLLLDVSDDPEGVEERAHLSLVQHPNPQNVLWIGGSLGGARQEALRHPSLERLDVVELNPALFQLATGVDTPRVGAQHAEDPLVAAPLQGDSRVVNHADDGRRFLARASPQTYDMICLNLPGPRTVRLSKFYTLEGFQLVKRALRPGGALVFGIGSSEDYIGPDLALLLKSIYVTLMAVFPRVEVLPGGNAIFVAGDSSACIVTQADSISSRLAARGIEPLYWDRYRLEDRFSSSRKATLGTALHQLPVPKLNRDRTPISFYWQQVFWSQQVRGGLPALLKALRGAFIPACIILIAAAFLLAAFLRLFQSGRSVQAGVAWAVAMVGLSGISLEILTLIAYQVQFGSGYREVGILLGCYMIGSALGAWATTRIILNRRRLFMAIQSLWVAAPVGLLLISWGGMSSLPYVGHILFLLYLLLLGLLGGLHFPLAAAYFDEASPQRAGKLYALDLLGAALGAVIFGLMALPLAGIYLSAIGLFLLNLPPLLLLASKRIVLS